MKFKDGDLLYMTTTHNDRGDKLLARIIAFGEDDVIVEVSEKDGEWKTPDQLYGESWQASNIVYGVLCRGFVVMSKLVP